MFSISSRLKYLFHLDNWHTVNLNKQPKFLSDTQLIQEIFKQASLGGLRDTWKIHPTKWNFTEYEYQLWNQNITNKQDRKDND